MVVPISTTQNFARVFRSFKPFSALKTILETNKVYLIVNAYIERETFV